MKFIVSTVLTGVLAFIVGLYFPWWSIAVSSLLVAILVHQRPWKAFLAGLLGVLLCWGGLAFWIDMKNNGILSTKIAQVLPLGGNSLLLVLVTGVVGGLVSGFAALTGSYVRSSK